jgi:hypothetical protein
MITIKHKLEGSQARLHKPSRLKGTQQPAQGRAPPLFIAPKQNRDIGAKLLVSAMALDMAVPGTRHGGAPPNDRIASDRGDGGTTLGVAVTT